MSVLILSEANTGLTVQLKHVLLNFAVPNNETLQQASKELHVLSQHSSFLSSLFYILSNDENVQLRQTAAVVFRRKVMRLWKSVADDASSEIRQSLLHVLVVEKEALVQHAIMEIIGGISKLEYASKRNWPDLMNFIEQTVRSSEIKEKERGSELLKIVCECSAKHFQSQYDPILILISEALKSNCSPTSAYNCVEAFNCLIPYLGDDQSQYVRPLVPQCVQVIKMLLQNDCESLASELVEIFESLIETEVSFIAAYVKDLVVFVLQIAGDSNMDDEIKARVLSVLQCLISSKKKAILKNKLLGPILDVICPMLLVPIDVEENDFGDDSSDDQSPFTCALHVIDDLALHLPPKQLFKKLMPFVQICASSNEEHHKRALYLILAYLAEGTSEYIKSKHLKEFLEVVCRGVTESQPRLKSAALFALGQFSEHLQPDICQFASEIIPLLFDVFQQANEFSRGSAITKAYFTLENLIENLESDVLPYLDKLMDHLLLTLRDLSVDAHVKELAMSSISSIAMSAKEHLLPYLPEIMNQILNSLPWTNKKDDEVNFSVLHIQSLDTLSMLVRNLGKLNMQLAEDSMKLGIRLIEIEDTDPDLTASLYILFAAVASVVGGGMQPFLSKIVENMIYSIQSTDGLTATYTSHTTENHDFAFLDDSTSSDLENGDEDLDTDQVESFTVDNSFMEQKVRAIDALGDFAQFCGESFKSYLEVCLVEIFKLQDYPHVGIRRAAITATGQMLTSAHQYNYNLPDDIKNAIFPGLSFLIAKDTERLVAWTAVTASKDIIESCGLEVYADPEKDLRVLMNSILSVFQQTSSCQDYEIDEDDDQQAEYDEMLIEACGDILPILADKLKKDFLPYFLACLPYIVRKLKPSCSTAEKSFAAGTIAETIDKIGPCFPGEVLQAVIPQFIQLSRDPEIEVRNNVLYGLGTLLQNGGEAAFPHYRIVLECLSQALFRETSRRVLDNILSSLARMITTNKQLMSLPEILPVFLDHLPIEEDHDEDIPVYSCLAGLLKDPEVNSVLNWVAKIVDIFAQVMTNDQASQDVLTSLDVEIKNLKENIRFTAADVLNNKNMSYKSRQLVESLWMS